MSWFFMKKLDLLTKSALVLKIFSKKAAHKEAEIPFCRRKLSRFFLRMSDDFSLLGFV